jgi:hypothetical protein
MFGFIHGHSEIIERWHRAAFRVLLMIAAAAPMAYAQSPPRLSGRIETDPSTGVLRGDICLSALPPQQPYSFLLNRGLNIREVRDAATGRPIDYDGFYDATGVGDATRYTLKGNAGAGGFCVSYVGAYPVYRVDAGERSENDWKGQIAFDGRTVRAAEQTRFYPVVIDSATGAPLATVSYQLDVECRGCAAIYVNGSQPKAGPRARFSSSTPRQLLLYAGDFPFTSAGDIHFVGAGISSSDAGIIRSGIKAIADTHAAYLGIPYGDEPAYLTFAAVSRRRTIGKSTWAFVTWPTIALDGRIPFSQLLKEAGGRRVFTPSSHISHEMAHYYFGTRYAPRGPLQWFLLESTAEFMAMKARRTLAGEAAYAELIRAHYKEAAAGEVTPLDSVREAEQIGENYRYHLGPLLLIALEQYVGESVVRKTLGSLVNDPAVKEVGYADFHERLLSAGASATTLKSFEAECLHSAVSSGCLSKLPHVR